MICFVVPKGKPLDVTVMGDGSGTALIVTWKPPQFDLINSGITRYLLEYRKPNQKKATPVDLQVKSKVMVYFGKLINLLPL